MRTQDARYARNDEFRNSFSYTAASVAMCSNICSECGHAEARVVFEGVPYCRDCHNRRVSDRLGVRHFTDERLDFSLQSEEGARVTFDVEHMLTGSLARWFAREVVAEDDERLLDGYEGLEAELWASALCDPMESRRKLIAKAERRVKEKSLSVSKGHTQPGQMRSGCVQRDSGIITAESRGIAHITEDDYGRTEFIIDDYRFTVEKLLRLLNSAQGFDLHWQIKHTTEDDIGDFR